MDFERNFDSEPVSLDAATCGVGGVADVIRNELSRIEDEFSIDEFEVLDFPEPGGFR